MSTIINGTSSAITFPDSSVQNTSAIVSGYVPYANLPAGSVLQVVNVSTSTPASSSSSSYSDTGLTATITPKFATSKIFVIATLNGCGKQSSNTQMNAGLQRGATVLKYFEASAGYTGTTANSYWGSSTVNYLDSPATTSATTYKLIFKSYSNTGVIYLTDAGGVDGSTSFITLLEIAG